MTCFFSLISLPSSGDARPASTAAAATRLMSRCNETHRRLMFNFLKSDHSTSTGVNRYMVSSWQVKLNPRLSIGRIQIKKLMQRCCSNAVCGATEVRARVRQARQSSHVATHAIIILQLLLLMLLATCNQPTSVLTTAPMTIWLY